MTWKIEEITTEDAWFRHAVDLALRSSSLPLPPREFRVGASNVSWLENEPGVASVFASGGTVEDRVLARQVAQARLASHGYRQAQYTFDQDGLIKEATWDDIMAKAKRLIQSGQVQLLRNGEAVVVGQVKGDHGEYQTEISRDDPNSRVITQWTCECPWDQFAFQRTRQWKKYEGRPCAHVLATYWKSLGTPVDEHISPQNQGPGGQMVMPGMEPGQLQQAGPGHFFNPSLMGGPPIRPLGPGRSVPALPPAAPGSMGQQLPFPGMQPPQPPAPPGPPQTNLIPPFPMDALVDQQAQAEQQSMMQQTVSVPGGKPPTPANPVQYPGGTLSSWKFAQDELQPGMAVQLLKPETGMAVGKSTAHGAGQWREIPQGSVGEFVSQDQTTGFIEIRVPLHAAGPMEPYHVEVFVESNAIKPRPDIANPFEKTWPGRKV